jgi:hypothetical protein
VIVWLNAAAGLIGIEDDGPANLLYAAVLAIGCIGGAHRWWAGREPTSAS